MSATAPHAPSHSLRFRLLVGAVDFLALAAAPPTSSCVIVKLQITFLMLAELCGRSPLPVLSGHSLFLLDGLLYQSHGLLAKIFLFCRIEKIV